MKKLLPLLFLLLVGCHVQAATFYACACGVGAAGGCTPGSNTAPYDTPTKSMTSLATYSTIGSSLAAGDHLSTCQGGAFNSATNISLQNTNSTKTNPVYFDTYDDTARWTGGSGIRPRFNSTAAGSIFAMNKGTLVHTEGYVVDGIDFEGDGVNTNWAVLMYGDDDYITFNNVKVSGSVSAGLQCLGGGIAATATNDTISSHLTIQNSVISGNKSIGILSSCPDTTVQSSTFTLNGTTVFDHDIYIGGSTLLPFPQTITSITGNGTTATLTTALPHGIPSGSRMTIAVTGSTSSGSGTFNVTGGVGGTLALVTGPNTITYQTTGTPTASVVGTYQVTLNQLLQQFVIRNNTLTEADTGSGTCNLAHIVVHGNWTGGMIEGNTITEAGVTTSGTCNGIEIDNGVYTLPEDYEGFFGMVVRSNTIKNMAVGIALDNTQRIMVENNFVYSAFAGGSNDAFGIRSRNRGGSAIVAGQQNPDQITVRYNSIYLTAAAGQGSGIAINRNTGDPTTGTHHNIYGNVVVFGATATTGTMCFDTTNMLLTQFDVIDYNACYYLGASAPAWRNTSSLATVQGGGGNTADTHSLFASTASVTTGQPFFTAPTTTPAIGTSSALKNAGHPTLGPNNAWGAAVRNQGLRDIGAFEFGATLGVVPGSPTRVQ